MVSPKGMKLKHPPMQIHTQVCSTYGLWFRCACMCILPWQCSSLGTNHVYVHTCTYYTQYLPSLSAMCMSVSGDCSITESGASKPAPPLKDDVLAGCAVVLLRAGEEFVNAVCGGGGAIRSGVKGWSLVGDPVQQFPILARAVVRGQVQHMYIGGYMPMYRITSKCGLFSL